MPKYGPHINGIEDIVHKKIAELGLVPSYVFDASKNQERFYTVPCRDKKKKKVIFKMRTEDYTETKEYFRREIRINELFTRFYKKGKNLSVPLFIDGDAEQVPEWMVYEFIEGFETGDFYNGFEKGNIKKFSVESLIAGMKNMHQMSAFAKGEIKLEKEKYADYEKSYEKYEQRLDPFFSKDEIKAGMDILAANRNLLDCKNEAITHGDFHPGNIIIKNGGGIAIIDWYNVHLNNAAFDIAFLSLEITDKDFRNKILEQFVKEVAEDEMEFWQLFRLDVLRLVPQKINVLCDALYTFNPTKEDYYAKLTQKGLAKLETNLEFFKRALLDINFL